MLKSRIAKQQQADDKLAITYAHFLTENMGLETIFMTGFLIYKGGKIMRKKKEKNYSTGRV